MPASSFVQRSAHVTIGARWDGSALESALQARVGLYWGSPPSRIRLTWDAPHDANGSVPPVAPGFYAELWRFEVVEVFIAGAGDAYLEFEVGPLGHFAAFKLGARRRIDGEVALHAFEYAVRNQRFTGALEFDAAELPQTPLRWNAYRISGEGATRTYCAAFPASGPRPDFHNLESFEPVRFT